MKRIENSKFCSKGKNRQKKIIFIAGMTAFTLLISILQPAAIFSDSSVHAATISQLNEDQANIEKKLAEIQKEKENLKNQSKNLEGSLSWLNGRTIEERKKYQDLVDKKNAAFTEMENSLKEAKAAEEDVAAKQEQYRLRLQAMFENRNKGTLEMLFDAQDIKGFLANIQLIAIIADSDKKVLNDLIAAKDEAYLKKKAADDYCAEMQTYVDQQNAAIEELKNNLTQTQAEKAATDAELAKAEKDEKALQQQSDEIDAQIKKLQSSGEYYGGTMTWPTPGYTSINPANAFGMRMHPIYHYMRMHNGVDIGAPFDSKIVAVADGKVIVASTISGYNPVSGNNYGGSGYGNYIIIDHGGGISSVYGHCKLLKVKVGDTVKKGQWIAVTGSTGLSTGAHLHFEIRENGTPVDPIQKKYLGTK